jgi:hypothetical protein
MISSALGGEDCAFWVWHRRDPLRVDERQPLSEMGATLLWHVGVLDAPPSAPLRWLWRTPSPEAGAIPVVRLNFGSLDPLKPEGLAKALAGMADAEGRLQIDYDCPDRLLENYAKFLGELRQHARRVSITALAGWSRSPAFPRLQEHVSGIDAMFYDLEPDAPQISAGVPPLPLLEAGSFAKQLARWEGCKVPWRAGLPNFSRVTLFDAEGRSRGHLRHWSWDEVVFEPKLSFISAPAPGVRLLRATADLVMAETPIKAGSWIAVRWIDRRELSDALAQVKKSASVGPVFFRLPDSSDPSGWSVSQLHELMAGRVGLPRCTVKHGAKGVMLQNIDTADLPPRLEGDGPNDRAYALELDAPGGIWREVIAGDFRRVTAHANPDAKPLPVSVPLATRLTFWFSHLRAGKSLETGLILLAPGADKSQIRYRIQPGDQEWKPLE